MPQFNVFANPNLAQREAFPYLVVIQSDLLDRYTTRLMMPLSRLPPAALTMPHRLSMTIEVLGERLLPAAHLCGSMPARLLKRPVTSLRSQAQTVRDALDAVVSGV